MAAACCRCDALTRETAEAASLGERLARGIEENEALYRRIRELESRAGSANGSNGLSASREKGRSVDSLSDLTNIDFEMDLTHVDKERCVYKNTLLTIFSLHFILFPPPTFLSRNPLEAPFKNSHVTPSLQCFHVHLLSSD